MSALCTCVFAKFISVFKENRKKKHTYIQTKSLSSDRTSKTD